MRAPPSLFKHPHWSRSGFCAMFNHILIAVDGGEPSARAAETGLALARTLSADVALFYSFEPRALELQPGVPWDDLKGSAERESQKIFDQLLEATDGSRTISRLTGVGAAAPAIIGAVGGWGADLIVIGSHGRDGILRAALGSVAEEVMRQARCPVLVVKAKEQASEGGR